VAAALCCALVYGLVGLVAAAPAAAAPSGTRPPGGNFADPSIRAVDTATPAVVRIGTSEQASLTLQLCSRSVQLPLSGGTYDVASTGSGAFISANGDILTADHVVHPPDDEVLYFAADDIAYVLDDLGAYDPGCGLTGGAVSANDVANGLVNLKYTVHTSGLHSVVWLSTAYSGPINATSLRDAPSLPATVEASSSYTNDDVAIVRVNQTDMPSISLGSSADVAVEDALTVVGFPGNGDVTLSPNNMLTPSVNNVTVSALKMNDNGSPLIQVAGNVEHGDSGGPLLNAQGEIVGVVSFGAPDPQGSTTFMRASSSVQPLITSQSINTAPGHFQTAWSQAFDEFAATYPGHWHAAQAKMEALNTAYPQFKALAPYLQFARTAAAQEQLPQPGPSTTQLLVGGGVAILIVVLAALVLILFVRARARRKRRAPLPPAGVMPVGFALPYAGGPQPYGSPYGIPPQPFARPPYGGPASGPPTPFTGQDGQPLVGARLGGYGAAVQGLPFGADYPPSGREGNAPFGEQPYALRDAASSPLSGLPPASARPPALGTPEPPFGSDAYNVRGGGDGTSGH
jgi:S1-C subfamily serine protease